MMGKVCYLRGPRGWGGDGGGVGWGSAAMDRAVHDRLRTRECSHAILYAS